MAATSLDLLTLLEPAAPHGGLGLRNSSGATTAIWREAPADAGLVGKRIVHARTLRLAGPTRLRRLGVRPAPGYHKCGSEGQWDWVVAFRLLAFTEQGWRTILAQEDLPEPAGPDAEPLWFDLDSVVASAAVIEVLRSGLDGYWPGWNLTQDAFVLEGDEPPMPKQRERRLGIVEVDPIGLPAEVTAEILPGEVRYRAPGYAVGFSLGRAGLSFLALDDEQSGKVDRNLLFDAPGAHLQGIMLHPVGQASLVGPASRCDVTGEVTVEGNRVRYDITIPDAGQRIELDWVMHADRIELNAVRHGEADLEAWESSIWQIAWDPGVAATDTMGQVRREGRTGLLDLPVLLHAPGHGNLLVSSADAEIAWRSDADRPQGWMLGELKLGESQTEHGTYLLRQGTYRAAVTWSVGHFGMAARPGTPEPIAKALRRTAITGLSYRADTGTYSNNADSMHCPMSMDSWSALANQCGEITPGIDARLMLRDSLERWLDGGPGYASGIMRDGDELRPAEDEYLISGVGTVLGLAEHLEQAEDAADWLRPYRPALARKLTELADRDLDGDGLIESPHRTGVSGEYNWSTNWYDTVSFGWKDAYVNAFLYRALRILARELPRLGHADLAGGLEQWADRLQAAYLPTFFNPKTGWFAGWRCKEGQLHDYAFLSVNAMVINSGVVADETARKVARLLWQEYQRLGAPDPRWGLPCNLWPIPDRDLPELMHGLPHGFYLNGALSHSQSRHFVEALYRWGMSEEADELLTALCTSLADGTAFGGSQSGIDWKYWDGGPCGYEGQLTEQFSIMAVAMERYGRKTQR